MTALRARGVREGKLVASEYEESTLLADWLRAHRICFVHVPNERTPKEKLRAGERSPFFRHLEKLKRMGADWGFPDYLIFDSPPARPDLAGVAIEMKAQGGRPSSGQKRWLGILERRRWWALICFSGDDAIKHLKELGYGG